MLLRNHGIICCGETIEEAWYLLSNAVAACETQVSISAPPLSPLPAPLFFLTLFRPLCTPFSHPLHTLSTTILHFSTRSFHLFLFDRPAIQYVIAVSQCSHSFSHLLASSFSLEPPFCFRSHFSISGIVLM